MTASMLQSQFAAQDSMVEDENSARVLVDAIRRPWPIGSA